ncbi:MAG: META domain-containing protein [Neptuniibacter sp.]
MLSLKKLHLYFLPIFLLVLTGCQTSNFKAGSVTQISIENHALTRISEKALVTIEFRSDDRVLETTEFYGLKRLPFVYTPNSVSGESGIRAFVTVDFNGNQVVRAEKSLTPNALNNISLSSTDSELSGETYWKAVDIAGRGIPPYVTTTLVLRANGRVNGFAGCNQYRGEYSTLSMFMEFSQIENTHNICPNPVMYHENRYFKHLQSAELFEFESDQLSLFTQLSDKPIIYNRIDKQELLLSLRDSRIIK